jgi:hypothetical protein
MNSVCPFSSEYASTDSSVSEEILFLSPFRARGMREISGFLYSTGVGMHK